MILTITDDSFRGAVGAVPHSHVFISMLSDVPRLLDHLEIQMIQSAVISAGVFNDLGASWKRNHRKTARKELKNPPNRPMLFDNNVDEMITGSKFLGYSCLRGLTRREFQSNENHKKNLNTMLFELVKNGMRIPVEGMEMFRETASLSDHIILKMSQTLMNRYLEDPDFMLRDGYFDDINGGAGVSDSDLTFVLEFFRTPRTGPTQVEQTMGPIYLLPGDIGELEISEGTTSFTIAGFLDLCDLMTPRDIRQIFFHRMKFKKRTGRFTMTNQKVLWRILCNESEGISCKLRNQAISTLLNESTLSSPIFFHYDGDDQLWIPLDEILEGHWALQKVRENYMGSTVPRVAGILGLSSDADSFSKTNREGNRVMVPVRYKRLIPTMGYPSGTAYHPDFKPPVRRPELERAIGNFLTGQMSMEVQPNPEVFMISRCQHENREIKIISVRKNFDDLSSLQIMAETMQVIQDTENHDLGCLVDPCYLHFEKFYWVPSKHPKWLFTGDP